MVPSRPDGIGEIENRPFGVAVGTVLQPAGDVAFASADKTVLVGLSSTCHYCEASMPAFRDLDVYVTKHSDRLRIFAIALEPVATVGPYLKKSGLDSFRPVSIDASLPLAAVARMTPQIVVVNRQGKVVASWIGSITDDQMQQFLKKLMTPTGEPAQ